MIEIRLRIDGWAGGCIAFRALLIRAGFCGASCTIGDDADGNDRGRGGCRQQAGCEKVVFGLDQEDDDFQNSDDGRDEKARLEDGRQ